MKLLRYAQRHDLRGVLGLLTLMGPEWLENTELWRLAGRVQRHAAARGVTLRVTPEGLASLMRELGSRETLPAGVGPLSVALAADQPAEEAHRDLHGIIADCAAYGAAVRLIGYGPADETRALTRAAVVALGRRIRPDADDVGCIEAGLLAIASDIRHEVEVLIDEELGYDLRMRV